MIQVTVEEAKTNLADLVRQVLEGEDVIIALDGQPVVKLVALHAALPEAQPQRRLGGAAHVLIAIAPDFDEPLAEFEDYTS